MEHRFGNRRAIQTTVVLHPHGSEPVRAHTRDVSISGMFVESPPCPCSFSANSVLDVELTLPGTTGLRTYHWKAMVVRTTASGIALMFDRLRPPAVIRLFASVDAGLTPNPDGGADKVVPLRPVARDAPLRP